jgi:hypothetical protein
MTRNYVALFISIIIVLTALFEGFLGIHGMVVNTRLANLVEKKQQLLDVQKLELYNLEQRLEHVWDEDELLDRAKMMGYIQNGETPYYFIHAEENTSFGEGSVASWQGGRSFADPVATHTFRGISLWLNLVLASIVSCVLVGILKIVGRAHKDKDFPKRVGKGHGNYR